MCYVINQEYHYMPLYRTKDLIIHPVIKWPTSVLLVILEEEPWPVNIPDHGREHYKYQFVVVRNFIFCWTLKAVVHLTPVFQQAIRKRSCKWCLSIGGFRGRAHPARAPPPLHGPTFSRSHAVFWKNWQIVGTPWMVGVPPVENPGSAPAKMCRYVQKLYSPACDFMHTS